LTVDGFCARPLLARYPVLGIALSVYGEGLRLTVGLVAGNGLKWAAVFW